MTRRLAIVALLAALVQKTPGVIFPGVITPGKITPGVLEPLPETGACSILGFDPDTGEIGAAVQSRVFSVGNGVLLAEAEVGAVATQAIVDVGYGPKAMTLLRQGMAPKDIIKKLLDDD